MINKRNLGIILVPFFALVPVLIWLGMLPLASRFGNPDSVMTSLGQLAGLLGMVLFSLDLILSARLKWLEQYFWGLNKVYIWHHLLGGLAFIFLMFHPLFLVYRFAAFSVAAAVQFLFPGLNNPAEFWGFWGLFLMMILLILTFYIRPRYNVWKFLHRFLGLAFLFGVAHVYLITSDTSRSLFLRYYILGWAWIGMLCILYRSLLHKYLVPKFVYTVLEIKKNNGNLWEIILQPKDKRLNFKAGQFVFTGFKGKDISEESHPFSLASGPQEEKLKIVIKALGDYTKQLDKLRVGDFALIEGPFGVFTNEVAQSTKQIWIAGGIGITPFLSMAKSLTDERKYNVDLYYCVNEMSEAVFWNQLKQIEEKNVGLRMIAFCSKEKGRVSASVIKESSGGLEDKDIFVCGPPAMMKSLKKQFLALNISAKRFHSEDFGF